MRGLVGVIGVEWRVAELEDRGAPLGGPAVAVEGELSEVVLVASQGDLDGPIADIAIANRLFDGSVRVQDRHAPDGDIVRFAHPQAGRSASGRGLRHRGLGGWHCGSPSLE
jgi:hypothetical protein